MEYRTIEHTFEPVYDSESRILILGSLPSVKSRENNFYYGHPQNRFWRVLWEILGESGTEKNEVKEFCGGNMQGDGSVSEKLGDKVSGMQKGKKVYPIDTFSIEEKKEFLHANHIALWDVIARCDIAGSSDSSIKNVVPNDISVILQSAPIENIYVNGGKAHELYMRYCYPLTGREAVKLPSTSPANAAWTLDRLVKTWNNVKK